MSEQLHTHCCKICFKHVRSNQKSVQCEICLALLHLKCTAFTADDLVNLKCKPNSLFCPTCLATIFPFNHIADSFEFDCCLYNLNCNNHINADVIKNSQQLKLTNKLSLCNTDIDPDKQIFSQYENLNNKYYLEHDFNSMILHEASSVNFSVMHINARSLSKNLK